MHFLLKFGLRFPHSLPWCVPHKSEYALEREVGRGLLWQEAEKNPGQRLNDNFEHVVFLVVFFFLLLIRMTGIHKRLQKDNWNPLSRISFYRRKPLSHSSCTLQWRQTLLMNWLLLDGSFLGRWISWSLMNYGLSLVQVKVACMKEDSRSLSYME